MGCCCPGMGEGLITAAAGLAIAIGQGHSAEELGVLAGFFTVLGDNLAMLALQASRCEELGES